MTNETNTISITDSKERVAFELYLHIFHRMYFKENQTREFHLDLYKECLRAVKRPDD